MTSFRLGLKTSSVKKLLRCFRQKEKYWTDDRQTSIWRKNSHIHFRFNLRSGNGGQYLVELDEQASTKLMNGIERAIGVIPAALQPFANVQDEQVATLIAVGTKNDEKLNDPEYWEALGIALGTAQELKAASTCFQKALQLSPSHHTARLNLAVNQNISGQPRRSSQDHSRCTGWHFPAQPLYGPVPRCG